MLRPTRVEAVIPGRTPPLTARARLSGAAVEQVAALGAMRTKATLQPSWNSASVECPTRSRSQSTLTPRCLPSPHRNGLCRLDPSQDVRAPKPNRAHPPERQPPRAGPLKRPPASDGKTRSRSSKSACGSSKPTRARSASSTSSRRRRRNSKPRPFSKRTSSCGAKSSSCGQSWLARARTGLPSRSRRLATVRTA